MLVVKTDEGGRRWSWWTESAGASREGEAVYATDYARLV